MNAFFMSNAQKLRCAMEICVMMEVGLRVIDWFVPMQARRNKADFGRARTFVFTHLFGPAMGSSIVAFLIASDPHPGIQCVVIAGCIAAIFALPFVLKFTANLQLAALLSVQNLLFVTLYGSYFYGGVSSPFLPWLLVALLLGFFYLGDRPLTVLAVFVANLAGFFVVWWTGGAFPQRMAPGSLSAVGLISVFSATLYMAWMAIYYSYLLTSESEVGFEVSRHRDTAERLRFAKDQADKANRDKSVFLAKMSHELRTPLNAVIGYSEILLEDAELDAADEQRAKDLRRINTAGKHLLSLVTDVLDMSKIEQNAMELRIADFDVRSMLADVIATAQPLVQHRKNRLVAQFDSLLGHMRSDETRLRQVVLNLLSNAAKFTDAGVITLVARRHGNAAGDWVEIDVRDTGIGIAAEDFPKLFQDFGQVTSLKARKVKGTGLGLALSQKLCGMLGGGITVQSQLGQGSSFTVRIPAVIVSKTAPKGEPAAAMAA